MRSNIGEFLSILRKSKGLTQQEVADALGVSNKTVSSWETGASCPDISMLPAIAELFGVTCDELLRGERIAAAEPAARAEEKREKALGRMLASLQNNAVISAWISIGLYLVAAIAVLLIGCAALESLIGFFVGLIFVLGGTLFNLIHYKVLRFQLTQDDFESAALQRCKRFLAAWQRAVLIVGAAALGFLLPHIEPPVHSGLDIKDALLYGAIWGAVLGVLAWLLSLIIGAVVRTAKHSYRTTPKKFFWTLKHGVIPYTLLGVLAVALFFGTMLFISLRSSGAMVGVPYYNFDSYAALQQQLEESALFSQYEHSLYDAGGLEKNTITAEVLAAAITEDSCPADWRIENTTSENAAVYYFAAFPQEFSDQYDHVAEGEGAFVRVPVFSVTLRNGMVFSCAILNPEFQGGVTELTVEEYYDYVIAEDEPVFEEGDALCYTLMIDFRLPLYYERQAARTQTAITIQVTVTAAAWLLLAGGYTAFYLPRRKKFLQNLPQDDHTATA